MGSRSSLRTAFLREAIEVSQRLAFAAAYLVLMTAWVYGIGNRTGFDSYDWLVWVVLAAQPAMGLLVGRWWALLLPVAVVVISVPAGLPPITPDNAEPFPSSSGSDSPRSSSSRWSGSASLPEGFVSGCGHEADQPRLLGSHHRRVCCCRRALPIGSVTRRRGLPPLVLRRALACRVRGLLRLAQEEFSPGRDLPSVTLVIGAVILVGAEWAAAIG